MPEDKTINGDTPAMRAVDEKLDGVAATTDTAAMRKGNAFPPGSNGDTVNQHPAAAQNNLTALDHDPMRLGVTTENANDPLDKPEVKRDLTTFTPGPDPVDAPMPNRAGADLQQPTDADRAESRRLKEAGAKGEFAGEEAPNPKERKKAQDKALGRTTKAKKIPPAKK